MRNLTSLYFVICFVAHTQGQHLVLDQYFQNNYLMNPAVTGIESYLDLQLAHRNQWTNIDGAPETTVISVHGSLNPNGLPRADFNQNPLKNPVADRMFQRSNRNGFSGIGGFLMRDKVGVFHNLELGVSYAYHIPLSQKLNLSLGIAPSLNHSSLDTDVISPGLINDPAITGFQNTNRINLKIGTWLYGSNSYFGLTYIRSSLGSVEDRQDLMATTGYRFDNLTARWTFIPFAASRFNESEINFDLGLKANWRSLLWVGTVYRTTRSITYFIGINPNTLLGLTYLFSSGLEASSENLVLSSHEVGLQFRLLNRLKVICPQHLF